MHIHIITVGQPKLGYAKQGWEEYLKRLKRFHTVRVTHISDKYAYDPNYIQQIAGNAYTIALVVDGQQFTSPGLAAFLEKRALTNQETCFLIGGPEGLPEAIISQADFTWGLSRLTFPHDLAMVVVLETLYRASSINSGLPYHK